MEPKRNKWIPYVLIAGAFLLLLIFFVVPFAQLVVFSFWKNVPGSFLPQPGFFLDNYYHLLVNEGPYYMGIYGRTIKLALIATFVTFVISYPLSWYIAKQRGYWKSILIILIMLPMIGGAMIQTLGWIILLSPLGVINGSLLSLGIISTPIQFLGEELGIIIGLTQSYIPMMVLPLVTAIGSLDPALEDAASSLGAGFFTTFFSIVVPLSKPGAIAGVSLVFLSNLTSFVTPLLLGQGKVPVFGTVAYVQGIEVMNYPFASAFALFPMAVLALGLVLLKVVLHIIHQKKEALLNE